MNKDIFISHASEDKEAIVEPLVQILEQNDISCWYDKHEIGWGDSIAGKINEGLDTSKYVVFILSHIFLAKEWTKIELDSTLSMQISSGEKKVLPIIVGDIKLSELPPLLRDKKYIEWSHQQEIVDALKTILGKDISNPTTRENTFSIPMPKKRITQLDKDRFSKEIYQGIIKYFEDGLKQLKKHDTTIETDMTKVNELKFVATIYIDGEKENQCKIWMGGVFGSSGISYATGNSYMDISNDNSFNDWLTLEEDEEGLYMKGSAMNVMLNQKEKLRNERDAGEYFWKSFIQFLER